jgi:CRISPR/Cas system-associated exonuclease Cas4 (RecB family)
MNSFLFEAINDLYDKEGEQLHDVCIVVPSKRAGIHITKCFGQIINKPIFLPQITTINELVKQSAGITIIDSFILVYKLFEVYKRHIKTEESFDEFYYWGEMLLNDFDDIDKYNISAKDLFSNIEAYKDIDRQFSYLDEEQIDVIRRFWGSFIADKLTADQDSFYEIWTKLYPIYTEFTKLLHDEKVGYEGLAYKLVIDGIQSEDNTLFPKSKYLFLGFNALNRCEHLLFKHLNIKQKARFYWDVDRYYYDDPIHEAGYFVRQNIKMHGNELNNYSNNLLDKKDISIISAPSSVVQVKHIATIIKQWVEHGIDLSSCAVILCDENLLLPMLYSLPPEVKAVNITMGFPLKVTPVYTTIQSILKLQKNYSSRGFLYQDVMEIADDALLKPIVGKSILQCLDGFVGHAYDGIDETRISSDAVTTLLFKPINNGTKLLQYIQTIIVAISKQIQEQGNNSVGETITLECLYTTYTTINTIVDLLEKVAINERSMAINLFKKALQALQVPFAGEPLAGMQIMGILESRLLDFDHIVFVSANEGIMPTGKAPSSFIPFSLRQGFGLPTIKQRDAIYAYYFYRAMQRTSSVTILYSTQTNENGGGEMSRYASQLLYDDSFKKTIQNITVNLYPQMNEKSAIEKTNESMDILLSKFTGKVKGLSPSAINMYLYCEVQFYYNYITGLHEVDEILELPDELEFGDLYHKSMQNVYKERNNTIIDNSFIQHILDNPALIESFVRKAFAEIYRSDSYLHKIDGYKNIIFDVIVTYVKNTLEVDKQSAPFELIGVEYAIDAIELPIVVEDTSIPVVLSGNIDRVERYDNHVRIIDYKTGKRDSESKDWNILFASDEKQRNGKVFQTLLYSYLFAKKTGFSNIKPMLYFVRESTINSDASISVNKQRIDDFGEFYTEFEDGLKTVLQRIFDRTVPFVRTLDEVKCKNCAYKEMCRK